ncbi:ACT domain-containing protein [Pyrococcus kukulkanii]|uniref:ACT domain-containing protein n=1 Tax=Pyrococcus kukulkanii TaxID=1609559 RepID=UPI00356A1BB8
MREYFIVKVKENGKLEIPLEFAYEIGLVEGAYFLVEVDTDLKEMHVERVALPGKKLVEVEVIVEDKPGALAKVSGTLGRLGINILFNEAEELESLGLSAIVAIVDMSESNISFDDLKKELEKIKEVKEVKVLDMT